MTARIGVERVRTFKRNACALSSGFCNDVEFARQMVRLAALTHDLGHLPFSHAAEGILPLQSNGKPYKHEHYSCAMTEHLLKHILEARTDNENRFDITSREVAEFLAGRFPTRRLASLPGGL
jgi:HD superfamily phosphohydrolase